MSKNRRYSNTGLRLRQGFLTLFAAFAACKRPAAAPPQLDVLPAPSSELGRDQALAHPEGYVLRIAADGAVSIDAKTEAGRFYAQQTVKQLGATQGPLELNDAPRFSWRGLHFDVARHFFPVSDIEHLLDLMALLKLNVFHWHLTDDQGWRLPIAKHPELTAGQQAYSRDDIVRVVAYAKERHITVVPEIDLPGHTRALLASHPELSCRGKPLAIPTTWGVFDDVLCAGNPDTYALVDDILEETAALFPGPYLHLGGDEVPTRRWDECPKCRALGVPDVQAYFLARAAAKVKSLGKRAIGWDEVLDHQAPGELVVMAWRNLDAGKRALAAKHDTILVPYELAYLDQPQSPYDDGAIRTEAIAAFEPPYDPHLLGVQANLWTEHVTTMKRAEAQLFPRLFAIADVAWSSAAARKANPLSGRLAHGRDLLDTAGVTSFVDPPLGLEPCKAFLDGGVLELRSPSGEIRYELSPDADVTRSSPRYEKPLAISSTTEISARVFLGAQASPIARGRIFVEPPLPALPDEPEAEWRYALFAGNFRALPDFELLSPLSTGTSKTLVPEGVPDYDWALRAERLMDVTQTRVHRFTVTSDDGARLYVDNRLVIDNDGLHGPRARSGEIALAHGVHRFRVEFFQRGGEYKLELR
jgi:hexosaminidase